MGITLLEEQQTAAFHQLQVDLAANVETLVHALRFFKSVNMLDGRNYMQLQICRILSVRYKF